MKIKDQFDLYVAQVDPIDSFRRYQIPLEHIVSSAFYCGAAAMLKIVAAMEEPGDLADLKLELTRYFVEFGSAPAAGRES